MTYNVIYQIGYGWSYEMEEKSRQSAIHRMSLEILKDLEKFIHYLDSTPLLQWKASLILSKMKSITVGKGMCIYVLWVFNLRFFGKDKF